MERDKGEETEEDGQRVGTEVENRRDIEGRDRVRERVERKRAETGGETKEERQRAELEERHRNRWRDQEERQRGETGGETGEKIQKRGKEDQKYRGERELESMIVEIHRGEI
jgi:hypothetical protein